ncbi:DVU3141 family protein [Falsiroseomonas sp. HW251]|uniref:DVU3141 family protein n=1 Tax=Falsiroseomonas sp. HW251 TaxID=3390998 RepID=UPI003D316C30
MIQDTCPRARRLARRATRAGGLALVLATLLAGCSSTSGTDAAAAATPAVPADPLVAFAVQATPGERSSILLADGRPAVVQMTRRYFAASGRECRELMIGSGVAQRVQVVCAAESGQWALARPLLPGGGVPR